MSFDALAPHYRWMEFILAGKKLHRCRTAFLPRILQAENILLLGEGHGRALVECRRKFPAAQITCLDASLAMLQASRQNLARHQLPCDRVEFIHTDALQWRPSANSCDLLVTNFFFDCFREEQVAMLVKVLGKSLTEDANWLIADFQVSGGGLKRLRSQLIIWSMYRFFRCATALSARRLSPPDAFLKTAGFDLVRRVESEWGLLRSDWWRRKAIA